MPASRSLRSMARLTFSGLLLTATVIPAVHGNLNSPKQYRVRCVMTHLKNGKTVIDAEPQLIVQSGVEGTFLAGGEIKADQTPTGEMIPFGIGLAAKVTTQTNDTVAVSAKFTVSNLQQSDAAGFVVDERAVRVAKLIKLGEPLVLKREDGASATLTLTEHTPAPAAK